MNAINEYLEQEPVLKDCVVCYLQHGDQVLLGVRKTSSTDLGVNRVAGIGGKFEKDETAEQALLREVQEEIGVTLTEFKEMGRVFFLFPYTPKWNQDVAVYVGAKWDGEPTESDETQPSWFPISDLPFNRMFVDNQHWVPQVLEGKRVDAIFLYDDNHQIQESRIEFTDPE
ncbi:hypothetical protein A2982_01330 [candidate division WWE3 bacterium RIFCSPLOWO2_01_FULL_39_13]|uniref:Oxidized purine nucleoside triphosphate hydrolase n=1 Tax=candidate division WWE3 bacterium RIFCSPLOWO2_01_FULL_39_13 TaxID=1802624 RepID=A0A1F4V4Q6_UNCKA|nr:MAG: hypothetical protein A2982_01330 [candidate division WWE3 bacterium RIFCSPLOWO2_01_FULL_39_13]